MTPRLEQLESRLCPTALTYGGGPLIPHAQVADLHADAAQTAYTDTAMQVVLSQYLPLLSQSYGVGAGTLNASIDVSPLAGNPTDAQIQQDIAAEIKAGAVPQPSSSQVYVYFLAPNQTVADPWAQGAIAGYHSFFPLANQPVYYDVIYDYPAPYISQIEAHEPVETVTDPQPLTGWDDRSLGGSGEIGDIWMWQPAYQFTLGGFLFSAPAAPDGSPIMPPVPTQQQTQQSVQSMVSAQPTSPVAVFADLAALAVEEFSALEYRVLALADPRDFAGRAEAAQQELQANPLLHTPQGQQAAAIGWEAFGQAIGGKA